MNKTIVIISISIALVGFAIIGGFYFVSKSKLGDNSPHIEGLSGETFDYDIARELIVDDCETINKGSSNYRDRSKIITQEINDVLNSKINSLIISLPNYDDSDVYGIYKKRGDSASDMCWLGWAGQNKTGDGIILYKSLNGKIIGFKIKGDGVMD